MRMIVGIEIGSSIVNLKVGLRFGKCRLMRIMVGVSSSSMMVIVIMVSISELLRLV